MGATVTFPPPQGFGASTFEELTDTFDFPGQALKGVRVNAAETALEPFPAGGGGAIGGGPLTVNRVQKAIAAQEIGNSSILDDGVTVTVDVDLTVTGNLIVNGTQTVVNVETMEVEDPLIELGKGNGVDTVDLGFYANYNDGTARFAGLFRDATDGKFRAFRNLTAEPTTVVNTAHASYESADMIVRTLEANVADGTAPLTITSTTVVVNLNADKVDGRDESEFFLLAGRAAGIQTGFGGTGAGSSLLLRASANTGAAAANLWTIATRAAGTSNSPTAEGRESDGSVRLRSAFAGADEYVQTAGLYRFDLNTSGHKILFNETGFPTAVTAARIESVFSGNFAHFVQVHGSGGTLGRYGYVATADGSTGKGGEAVYYSATFATAALAGRFAVRAMATANGLYLGTSDATPIEFAPADAVGAKILATGELIVGSPFTLTGTEKFKVNGDVVITGGLTSPAINDPTLGGTAIGTYTLAGTPTLGVDLTLTTGVDLVLATAGAGTMIGTGSTQLLAFWGGTPAAQPAGIADADGTLADVTTKFNSWLAKAEAMGLLAAA